MGQMAPSYKNQRVILKCMGHYLFPKIYRPWVLIYLINNIISNQISWSWYRPISLYRNYRPIFLESLSSEKYKHFVYLYNHGWLRLILDYQLDLDSTSSLKLGYDVYILTQSWLTQTLAVFIVSTMTQLKYICVMI